MTSIVGGMTMAPHRALRTTHANGMPTTVTAAMLPNTQLPVSRPRSIPARAAPITTRRTMTGQANGLPSGIRPDDGGHCLQSLRVRAKHPDPLLAAHLLDPRPVGSVETDDGEVRCRRMQPVPDLACVLHEVALSAYCFTISIEGNVMPVGNRLQNH